MEFFLVFVVNVLFWGGLIGVTMAFGAISGSFERWRYIDHDIGSIERSGWDRWQQAKGGLLALFAGSASMYVAIKIAQYYHLS